MRWTRVARSARSCAACSIASTSNGTFRPYLRPKVFYHVTVSPIGFWDAVARKGLLAASGYSTSTRVAGAFGAELSRVARRHGTCGFSHTTDGLSTMSGEPRVWHLRRRIISTLALESTQV